MNTKSQSDAKTKPTPRAAPRREGFVLPALLILAFVGVLFGLGRVLLYRYQCQQRIERQHELEKQYAVRSAIRWVETRSAAEGELNLDGPANFVLRTGSERQLQVEVRPVHPYYPAEPGHFDITNASTYGNAQLVGDSEEIRPKAVGSENSVVCQIGPGSNTLSQTGSITVDMSGTGSWLDDTYGRRYMVVIENMNKGDADVIGDKVRLFISPVDSAAKIGMTVTPVNATESSVDLWYFLPGSNEETPLASSVLKKQPENGYGMQISGNQLTVYYVYWPHAQSTMTIWGDYAFSPQYTIPDAVFDLFRDSASEEQRGKELQMVLELKRTGPEWNGTAETRNTFKRLQVLPAYEFEIWLNREGSGEESEMATVMHVAPDAVAVGAGKKNMENKAYTYDTHGVSTRGYARKRQD